MDLGVTAVAFIVIGLSFFHVSKFQCFA